jgi:protein phosphatase
MDASEANGRPEGGYPFLERTPTRRVHDPCAFVCAVTDQGRVRDHNEDTFFCADDGTVLIAADGLGGHAAGEVASALATRFVAEWILARLAAGEAHRPDQIEALIAVALLGAHEAVLDEAAADPGKHGMGTTLIVTVLRDDVAYVAHVGDVRAYLFGADGLTQITDDHSPVGELVRAGALSPEEARRHPSKHLITQAIGLAPGIQPELSEVDLEEGETLLLCSDGLWEALTDAEIADVVGAAPSAYSAAVRLADAADAAGAPDNVTVIVYRHWRSGDDRV